MNLMITEKEKIELKKLEQCGKDFPQHISRAWIVRLAELRRLRSNYVCCCCGHLVNEENEPDHFYKNHVEVKN